MSPKAAIPETATSRRDLSNVGSPRANFSCLFQKLWYLPHHMDVTSIQENRSPEIIAVNESVRIFKIENREKIKSMSYF